MPSKVKGTKSPNAASVVDLNAEFQTGRIMDLQLTNKVALVTGSTAGIGFAIGAGLAAEGAKVIINGRSEKRVDEAIAMIRQKHPQARLAACAGDLSDAEAAQRVTTDFPQVDILVNNVGVYDIKPFEAISDHGCGKVRRSNRTLQTSNSRISRKSFSPLFALARCSNASLAPTK